MIGHLGAMKERLAYWFRGERGLAFLLIAPLICLLAGLIAYPLVVAFYLSLTNQRIGSGGEFIGLANFAELLKDETFVQTAENALLYTVVAVGLKTILGLALALALATLGTHASWVRTLMLLPWVVPISITALAWWWMFDPLYSVLNRGLQLLGQDPVPWLSDPFGLEPL